MTKLHVFKKQKKIATLELKAGKDYQFGRGEQCDVRLPSTAGISRHHFSLIHRSGTWAVQVHSQHKGVLYKSVDATEFELGAQDEFHLKSFRFVFESDAVAKAPALLQASGGEPFEANLDATVIEAQVDSHPYLRIKIRDKGETELPLQGAKWIAGRDDTADIVLHDRKVSRKQFELRKTSAGTEICDLGSANGTHLNNKQLESGTWVPLKSGDLITIHSVSIIFELRDPHFQQRIAALPELKSAEPQPAAAIQNLPVAHNPSGFEVINLPVISHSGSGGAVRLPSNDPYSQDFEADAKAKKTKMIRVIAALTILGALIASQNPDLFEDQKPIQTEVQKPTQSAFDKLPLAQRKAVETLYVTARNLYLQGKFESTLDQLAQLHRILPDGYEASREIEDECKSQRAMAEELRATEQERLRLETQRAEIENNLRKCDGPSRTLESIALIRACLAPTLNLDPENAIARDYVARVERRIQDKESKLASQREYQDRIAKGKALFEKAKEIRKTENWFKAIDAFQIHIQSPYPDPQNLKSLSQTAIDDIRAMLNTKTETALKNAQDLYAQRNLRDALEAAKEAKAIDPKNAKANEFITQVRRELTSQLRSIYEDAILHEGVGQIELAQGKWKQILDRDTKDGEYYQKSKIKLRNYSEQLQ